MELQRGLELAYRLGWSIFAVNGKIPLVKWKTEAKRAWEWHPEATGYGVACEPSGLVVLDIDSDKGGLESLGKLEAQHGKITTFTVQTGGGGYHFYFDATNCNFTNRTGILPGVDLRARGGLVVGPGSLHPSGSRYSVLDEASPILPVPSWLKELLNETRPQNTLLPIEISQGIIPEGGRNTQLSKLAGAMRRVNASPEALISALQAENKAHFALPLRQDEVLKLFNWAKTLRPGDPYLFEPREDGKDCLVVEYLSLIEEAYAFLMDKDLVRGEPTGFQKIDFVLGGGKRLGELTTWQAPAKTGKNALWHKLMHMMLQKNLAIGYASRELNPATEVLPDLWTLELKTNMRLTPRPLEEIRRRTAKWPLYFTAGYGDLPFDAIEEWALELKGKGVQYLWFDHLHYLSEDPEDYKVISKLMRNLKRLTKEHNFHIDLITQPTKLQPGQELTPDTTRGGAAVSQAADNIFILKREEGQHLMHVRLAASRNRLARPGTVTLQYNPDTLDFIELEPVRESLTHKII